MKKPRNEVRFDDICSSAPWAVVFGKMTVSRHATQAEAERIAAKCNALLNRSSLSKMIVDTLKREIK